MKKVIKKIMVGLLAFTMMLTAIPTAVLPAQADTTMPKDLAGHWARAAIETWVTNGMGSGYPDGTFRPDRSVTRAEFAIMANKAFGITPGGKATFSDCKTTDWYYNDIAAAYNNGYISGYKGGSVKPVKPITRQEAAVMLAKLLNLATNDKAKFSDASHIPAWASGSAAAVAAAGVMKGYPDGSFHGSKNITRAEAVVAFSKAINIGSTPVVVPPTSSNDVIYDKSGTYGGDSVTNKTYAANVTIASDGITLKNAVVKGDLIIDKKVGEGDAHLENVKVEGSIKVNGGGTNSVYFVDVTTGKVYVSKDSGSVRIVVSGTSDIGNMIASSTVKFEEQNLNNSKGIEEVTIEKGVNGTFTVDLSGVKVDTVQVNSSDATIKTDATTTIGTLTAEAKVAITGQGTIDKLDAQASGITYEKAPTTIQTATGVDKPTKGSPTSSSSSGGGGSGSSTTTIAMISIAVPTGTARVASELTAGTLNPSGATVSYQWEICGTEGGTYTNIVGATTNKYTPIASDFGKFIKVVVTGTGNYVGTVTSGATAAVVAAQVAFSGLTANGTSNTVTTTEVFLTFDVDPTSLTASDITVTGAGTTKGTLTGSGTSRTLAITYTGANNVSITITIANPIGFVITPSFKTVTVYNTP